MEYLIFNEVKLSDSVRWTRLTETPGRTSPWYIFLWILIRFHVDELLVDYYDSDRNDEDDND